MWKAIKIAVLLIGCALVAQGKGPFTKRYRRSPDLPFCQIYTSLWVNDQKTLSRTITVFAPLPNISQFTPVPFGIKKFLKWCCFPGSAAQLSLKIKTWLQSNTLSHWKHLEKWYWGFYQKARTSRVKYRNSSQSSKSLKEWCCSRS